MAATADPRKQFWEWFRDNGVRLRDVLYGKDHETREQAAEELRERGAAVHQGVMLELGPMAAKDVRTLVVSADGRHELFDAVKDFAVSAPALPGWQIIAFRPRMAIGESMVIQLQDEEVSPEDIWFSIDEDEDGLRLSLRVRGLTPDNRQIRGLGARLLTEHAVGEHDTLTLLSALDIETLPDDPNLPGLRPFQELPVVFDRAKGTRYPAVGSLPLDPEGEWQMLQGSISGALALVLLNTGLRRQASHPSYDRRLVVSVPFNESRPDGLPGSQEEYSQVQDIGDSVSAALQEGQQSLLALTIMTQGRRELVFYTSNLESALQRLEKLRPTISSHKIETSAERDSFWGMYRAFLNGAQEAGEGEE